MHIPVPYQPKIGLGPQYEDQINIKVFVKYPIPVPALYGKKKEKERKAISGPGWYLFQSPINKANSTSKFQTTCDGEWLSMEVLFVPYKCV
jgi:hypothetical protein